MVDNYVVDILRGELVIEIQTGNFTNIRDKLIVLLSNRKLRLVYPIPVEKWIVRVGEDCTTPISRRKSPKRGRIEDLFGELVRFPQLVKSDNFSLEVLMIQEEDIWCNDAKGSWRRKHWSISDRRLLSVVGKVIFESPADYQNLIPKDLTEVFTRRQLSVRLDIAPGLTGKMVYCLEKIGVLRRVGKLGKAYLYSL